jgi:hypothetical protein
VKHGKAAPGPESINFAHIQSANLIKGAEQKYPSRDIERGGFWGQGVSGVTQCSRFAIRFAVAKEKNHFNFGEARSG